MVVILQPWMSTLRLSEIKHSNWRSYQIVIMYNISPFCKLELLQRFWQNGLHKLAQCSKFNDWMSVCGDRENWNSFNSWTNTNGARNLGDHRTAQERDRRQCLHKVKTYYYEWIVLRRCCVNNRNIKGSVWTPDRVFYFTFAFDSLVND